MADHNDFDRLIRKHKMKPVCKVTDEKHGDILIADSGNPVIEKTTDGYRAFYRTAWAILRDKVWLAAYEDYPVTAFPRLTERAAQEQRVNEALADARLKLSQTHEAGLYGEESSSSPVH